MKRHLGRLLVQRNAAARRLESHSAVAGSGDSDRTATVVGMGDRHDPGCHDAPAPDDEAPAVYSRFHGLRTGPMRGCSAEALKPNSDICVLPSGTRPVPRNTRANAPSAGIGRGSMVGVLPRRHARDSDVVLDERRHAVEVAAERARRRGAGPGTVERHVCQAVQRRIDLLGPGDGGVDEFGRRHSARPQILDESDGIKVAQGVVAEGVNRAAFGACPMQRRYQAVPWICELGHALAGNAKGPQPRRLGTSATCLRRARPDRPRSARTG